MRHVSALGHLRRQPGLSYSELARRAGITVQSMQATLTALEDAGAVERYGGGRGRAVTLTITPRGEQLLDGALRAFDRVDRDLATLLGPAAAQDLTTMLGAFLGRPPPRTPSDHSAGPRPCPDPGGRGASRRKPTPTRRTASARAAPARVHPRPPTPSRSVTTTTAAPSSAGIA